MKKILILIYVLTSAFGLCGQTYSEDFINDYPDKHRCQAKNRILYIYTGEHPTGVEFGELVIYIPKESNDYFYDENENLILNVKRYTESDYGRRDYISEETKYEYNPNGLLIQKSIIAQTDSIKEYGKMKYPIDYKNSHIKSRIYFRYDYPQMTDDGKPLRTNIYRTENGKEELYKVYRYNYSNNHTDISIYNADGEQIGSCKETPDKKLISKTTIDHINMTVTEEYNQHGDLIKAGTTHKYYNAYNSSAYNEIEYLSNGEISKRNIKTNASSTTIDVCEIFNYKDLDSIGNWECKYVTRTTSANLEGLGKDHNTLFNDLISEKGNKTTAYFRGIIYSNNKEQHKQYLKFLLNDIKRTKTLKDFVLQNNFIYEFEGFMGFGKWKLRVEKEFEKDRYGNYNVTKYLKRDGKIVNILKDGDTYTFYIKDKNTFVMIGSPCKLDNVSNITIDVLNGNYNDNNVSVKTLSTSDLELTYIPDLKLLIHQSDNGVKYYSISSKAIKALEEYNKK